MNAAHDQYSLPNNQDQYVNGCIEVPVPIIAGAVHVLTTPDVVATARESMTLNTFKAKSR